MTSHELPQGSIKGYHIEDASIPTSKLTGQLNDCQIASIAAHKVEGLDALVAKLVKAELEKLAPSKKVKSNSLNTVLDDNKEI